jgi:hypothetical protein
MIKLKTDSTKLNMSNIVILIVTITLFVFLIFFWCYCCFKCNNELSRRQILIGVDYQGNHLVIERIDYLSRHNTMNYAREDFEKPYDMMDNNEPEKMCSICLEEIGETECKLKCGHGFHFNCIREWAYVERKNNCPECRETIVDIDT